MGAQETKGLVNHLDRKISQSGVKQLIPKMNAELFIIIALVSGMVGFIVLSILTKNLLFGLIIFVAICLFFYALLEFRCTYVYKKEEKSLMMFMNLVHSYSVMTDDIIQILDMTSMHITDPLRSKIQDACIEARLSGNVAGALRNLSLKVSHEKLNEALANFEIGCKYQANYAEMVEAMSEDFRTYLKHKDENKAGSSAALIVQLIIFAVGFVIVYFANGMLETGTIGDMLLKTTMGNVIIGYFLVIILILIIKNLRSIR